MKGYWFYADLPGTKKDDKPILPPRTTIKQLRAHAGNGGLLNCIALLLGEEHRSHDGCQEAITSTFCHPDSDTSLGAVAHGYLRECRRIPEALARMLHPRLFARLDKEEA